MSRRRIHRPAGHRSGFTLIEVLISLAIFALAAVALSAAYLNLLQNYQMVRRGNPEQDELVLIRRVFLAVGERKEIETGGDVILPDERTARWKASIEETAVVDLFDATFEIELPPAAGTGLPVRYSEIHRLLRPGWSEEAVRQRIREEARRRLEDFTGRKLEAASASGSRGGQSGGGQRNGGQPGGGRRDPGQTGGGTPGGERR